jgi:hypothetical protein
MSTNMVQYFGVTASNPRLPSDKLTRRVDRERCSWNCAAPPASLAETMKSGEPSQGKQPLPTTLDRQGNLRTPNPGRKRNQVSQLLARRPLTRGERQKKAPSDWKS